MEQQKLTELSTEKLKKKEKDTKTIFIVFCGVYAFLIGVITYAFVKNGMSLLIVLPIVFLPILFSYYKNLKEIKREIKLREK